MNKEKLSLDELKIDAENFTELVELLESRDVFFVRISVLFDFDGIKRSAVFYHKVDLVHILIPVKVERRFGYPLVIVALDDL